jgi:hypothetical protein
MKFFATEEMGLAASLKLLDLAPRATIDDANRAYGDLHRMIDQFHRQSDGSNRGSREEDMKLLTRAYEKAVAYLSDGDSSPALPVDNAKEGPAGTNAGETGLHFTINFSDTTGIDQGLKAEGLPEPNHKTVEDAVSITASRLRQTETDLPDAQKAVDAARLETEAARRQHERAKQARIDAVVAAKAAKSRALLLEIEAKRAMEEAIAVAEKARDRAAAAKQTAGRARKEAELARKEVGRIRQSEETAAAQVICAEDRLDQEKARLRDLTHNLIQTRSRMQMFSREQEETKDGMVTPVADLPEDHAAANEREQLLSDLLDIEASLQFRDSRLAGAPADLTASKNSCEPGAERRRHPRVVYPPSQGPVLAIDGRAIPIFNASASGLCLAVDPTVAAMRIVRGEVSFPNQPSMKLTGRVVRQDDHGMGMRLVTRIGNFILDQERMRLIP